jgi:flagellar hook protein FlgE
LQGNLSASLVGPLAETLTSSQPYREGGVAATAATLLNNLDDNTIDYIVGDTINIQGTDVDGTAVSVNFAVTPLSTLGDLQAAISAAYAGATATIVNGNLVLTADNTGPASLSLTLTDALANTGRTSFNNHAMQMTVNGKDGDTVSSGIQVYDSQGTGHIMSVTFRKQGSNLWDMTVSIPAGEGTTIDNLVTGIEFNDDGSFRQVTGSGLGDPDVEIQFSGIGTPQTMRFFFGTANGFDGLTQFGGPSSAGATRQDGYAAGFLTSLSVSKDGSINGIFSNGQISPIAQLGVASFQNSAALNRLGNNYYAISTQSGEALIGGGLSGGRGSVEQGVLESSNVDVALEFTRLIIAQRGFQVNARTITASDTILQELAQVVR